ncbi:hypothetical protein C8F01DRAFT_1093287 [Mycena amicta]|nr:hypothetical protein C8F01DRAFT_1093287 [Mycena amicta]
MAELETSQICLSRRPSRCGQWTQSCGKLCASNRPPSVQTGPSRETTQDTCKNNQTTGKTIGTVVLTDGYTNIAQGQLEKFSTNHQSRPEIREIIKGGGGSRFGVKRNSV